MSNIIKSGSTPPEESPKKNSFIKISVSFLSLFIALVFFSGSMKNVTWWGWKGWGIFDFTTLNGSFGKIVTKVTTSGEGVINVVADGFNKGIGASGAMEGFLFAFGLVPSVMFALAMINIFEHYGALDAARKLLSPILRPLLGIPGSASLALVGSLQSTDVGASLTRQLTDENQLTEDQRDTFIMFQFSGGAMITNFFSSGAPLFVLVVAGTTTPAVPVSMGICLAVIFCIKIIGANLARIIFKLSSKNQSSASQA